MFSERMLGARRVAVQSRKGLYLHASKEQLLRVRATRAYHKVWARTTVNLPGSFELVIRPFQGLSVGV